MTQLTVVAYVRRHICTLGTALYQYHGVLLMMVIADKTRIKNATMDKLERDLKNEIPSCFSSAAYKMFLKEQAKKNGGRLRIPDYLKHVDDLTALPSPSSRGKQGGLSGLFTNDDQQQPPSARR